MGNKENFISVIIPFRENKRQVQDCIKSLKKQDYEDFEIILVSDKIKWKEKNNIKSIKDSKLKGVGEKRNRGVKEASGGILFFLDSDCTVKKDTLLNIIKIFDEKDTNAISGKTLAPKEGNLLGITTGLEYEDRFNRMGENYVDVAATTCFAVQRSAFEKIGGFEDYSKNEATGEDWDFSRKFTKSGFKIFHTNKVQVHHNHKNDTIKKWISRRIEHSEYRIAHKRKYGEVFEQYFSPRMFTETTILFSIPVALRMYKKSRRWEVLTLPIFAVLRNIAWFAGVVKGLMSK